MLKGSWFKIRKSKNLTIKRKTQKMREPIITKFTPNWIPTKKCDEIKMKSYSLDFTQYQENQEKVYVMNVSFILNGRFILTVQRRTKDFGLSTFQVILWEAKEVKQQVETKRDSQQELVVAMNDTISCQNQCFDLNFSEIHQVCVSEEKKLIVVGRTNKDNEVLQQFYFSIKGDSNIVKMKSEFTLSFSTRRLIVKK